MKQLHGFGARKVSVMQLLFFPMTRSSMLHQAVLKEEARD